MPLMLGLRELTHQPKGFLRPSFGVAVTEFPSDENSNS